MLGLVVLSVAALAGSAAAADGPSLRVEDATVGPPAQQSPTPVNNSSRPHRNPDAYEQAGDLEALESWFTQDMGRRLSNSTISISEAEYDRARRYLGEDFNHSLERFVDVAGDTSGSGDDRTGEQFRETQTDQRAFATALERYRRVKDAYETAKASGNATETRAQARRLLAVAADVRRANESLLGQYRELGNRTGIDFESERAIIENETESVVNTTEQIRSTEFIPTDLSARVGNDTASFLAPVHIQGTLLTPNGTTLDARRARISVAGRSGGRVALDGGAFGVQFRPVHVETGSQAIAVQYIPSNESVYLGAEDRVTVRIRQVQPNISMTIQDSTVDYGDRIRVQGRAAAGGTGIRGLPLAFGVGDGRTGNVETGPDGQYRVGTGVPATLSTGTHSVMIAHERRGRAIGPGNATATIRVVESETELRLNVSGVTDGPVLVGTLKTAEGEPVPGQAIEIAVNGTVMKSVETRPGGRFQTELSLPDEVGQYARVVGRFSGTGTNLAGSDASAIVRVPQNGQTGNGRIPWIPVLGGAGVLSVLLVGAVIMWSRRRQGGKATEGPPRDAGVQPATGGDEAGGEVDPESVLERPRRLLEGGDPGASIVAAYWSVRSALGGSTDDLAALTHWEFLSHTQDGWDDDERIEALETLTRSYEQAAFAEGDPDPDVTEQVLETARQLLE